jgi:thiosulfate/3-mercaptopyruvate sulfurtransferase
VFVEVDEDTAAYDDGHLAGAVRLDWKTELQDPVRRDLLSSQAFAELLSAKGWAVSSSVDVRTLVSTRPGWSRSRCG